MFESIEELEKQVAEFEQNILASKALIKSIDGVNSSIQNQQNDFDKQATALLDQMASIKESVTRAVNEINDNNNLLISDTAKNLTEQIASFNQSAEKYLESVKNSNDSQLKSAVKSLSDSQKTYTNRIDDFEQTTQQSVDTIVKQSDEFKATADNAVAELKTTNQEQIDAFAVKLEKVTDEYIRHLESVKSSISEMEKQLQEHYSLFLKKLETTNINTVADEIQLLKKQINTKFAILMGGIGVAVILAVIALFMR